MTIPITFTDNRELNAANTAMWNARQDLNNAKYCYNNWLGGITLKDVTKAQKIYDTACNEYQKQRMLAGMIHTYVPPTECEE